MTFYDGVNVIGTRSVAHGAASLVTTFLPAGTRALKAYYGGDAVYQQSSAVLTQTVLSVPSAALGAATNLNGGLWEPFALVVGDFNNDSKADLALLGHSGNIPTLSILLGKGDGSFLPPVLYSLSHSADSMVLADFNRDSNADIVVSAVDSQGAALVSLLVGNSDGTFRPPVDFPAVAGPLAVGDFNGDGNPDLILTGSTRGAILLGDRAGSFRAPLFLPSLGGLVADFNGDGKPDLAVAGYGLQILLGNGDATFRSAGTIGDGQTYLSALGAADFNDDGKPDLLVADNAGLSLQLGNGDGSFQAPVSLAIAGGQVAIGDFNGDGVPDIAVVIYYPGSISLLLGNGNGTFHLTSSYPSIAPARSVAGDFDGDGRIDLATVSAYSVETPEGYAVLRRGVVTGAGRADGLTLASAAAQSGLAGKPFNAALQVALLKNGVPVRGAVVNFSAPLTGPGAELTPASAITNLVGIATVNAVANNTLGSYTVTASYQDLRASFSLANTTLASISASGGTPQFVMLGGIFAKPLEVMLRDSAGNPAGGVPVTFTGPASGAGLHNPLPTVITDSFGHAEAWPIPNAIAGSYTVTASAGGLSASFSLSNTTITLTASGTPQSTLVGTPFALPLQVTVKDSSGQPVANQAVDFTVQPGGAGAILSINGGATTNAAGVATITATANNIPGSYMVTAGYWYLGNYASVPFLLTNLPVGSSAPNLALGKTTAQSSTMPGYPTASAASAVDGHTDGNFFNGSVASTNAEANPWWQVDLESTAAIGSIVLWNRTDCCISRLGDYWLFVSDTPFAPTDTPSTLLNRPTTWSSHQSSAPSPSANIPVLTAGRYVRIQLAGTDVLSLAEVQVFAPSPITLSPRQLHSRTACRRLHDCRSERFTIIEQRRRLRHRHSACRPERHLDGRTRMDLHSRHAHLRARRFPAGSRKLSAHHTNGQRRRQCTRTNHQPDSAFWHFGSSRLQRRNCHAGALCRRQCQRSVSARY